MKAILQDSIYFVAVVIVVVVVFVSVTLLGEETPSMLQDLFLDEIFSFSFNLVSYFFSKWNFSKNGFQLLVLSC